MATPEKKNDEKKPFLPPLPSLGKPGAGKLSGSEPLGGPIGAPAEPAPSKASPIPMWTSSPGDKLAGMPMFRAPGFARGGSIAGRLKSLKTKDLAFIGAGLAVLVMAPLAEYLVSGQNDQAGQLAPGFDVKGPFPDGGGTPPELGISQLARGGLLGENPDVITPLNARDPSSLIMGANGEEKAAPAAATPSVPKPEAPRDSVWDKVVNSAKSGATTAARKVGLPKPNVKLAGAINGLRSLSGGSSGASLKLSAPDSKGLFSSPRAESHLASGPSFRGAGARSMASGTGGGAGGLRGGTPGGPGGGSAGDVLNGGISGGGRGTGNGSPSDGETAKNPSGSSTKDNKALGESLDFLRRKMEMEKAIDLKWAKKRYDELERKKMIEQTLVQTAQQAFLKILDKLLEGKKKGDDKGGGGGGSPGGGGGGDPGKGKGNAPANDGALPQGGAAGGRLGQAKPASMKNQAIPMETEARRHQGESRTMIGKLDPSDLQRFRNMITNPGDVTSPTGKMAGALDRSIRAVSDAKTKLGQEVDKGDATLAKVKTVNEKLKAEVPKVEQGVQKAEAIKTAAAGAMTEMKIGGDNKYAGAPNVASLKTDGPALAAVRVNPISDQVQNEHNGMTGRPGTEQAAIIQQAHADIVAAYTAINAAPAQFRASMGNLSGLQQQALAAVEAAKRDVEAAAAQVEHHKLALNNAVTQAGMARANYEAAQQAFTSAQTPSVTMARDVAAAGEAWATNIGADSTTVTGPKDLKTTATASVSASDALVGSARTSFDTAKRQAGL